MEEKRRTTSSVSRMVEGLLDINITFILLVVYHTHYILLLMLTVPMYTISKISEHTIPCC